MTSVFATCISSTCSPLAPFYITGLILHIALVLLTWGIIVDPFYVILCEFLSICFVFPRLVCPRRHVSGVVSLFLWIRFQCVTVPVTGRYRCGSRLRGCYGYLPSMHGLSCLDSTPLPFKAPVPKLIFWR